jgi:ribosomal protein L11 methyltransferase
MSYKELILCNSGELFGKELLDAIKLVAFHEFSCLGINEFNLDETQVDEILGSKSYCGGDVTIDVIDKVDHAQDPKKDLKFYFESTDSNADLFKEYLKKNISNIEVNISIEQEQDWNAQWKKHYSTIIIDEKMNIVPSWENKSKPEDVQIYPGMGFGTGSHETTYLCLKLMKELEPSILTVLDHGCGSSILGIAANNYFNRPKVTLYDIDIQAYINSQQNMELNNTQDNVELIKPDAKKLIVDEYELVFANILLHILISEKGFILDRTKKGGKIIISGLLKEQVKEFKDKFIDNKLKFISLKEKGDWAALLIEKL